MNALHHLLAHRAAWYFGVHATINTHALPSGDFLTSCNYKINQIRSALNSPPPLLPVMTLLAPLSRSWPVVNTSTPPTLTRKALSRLHPGIQVIPHVTLLLQAK